jgi:hypothetical protein
MALETAEDVSQFICDQVEEVCGRLRVTSDHCLDRLAQQTDAAPIFQMLIDMQYTILRALEVLDKATWVPVAEDEEGERHDA